MNESTKLLISLSLDDGDQTELDELTFQLRSEIEQLRIDSIDKISAGKVPEGTKAADWIIIGNLVVSLAPTIIPPLFGLLKSWVERKPSIPVKIRIKVGKNKTAQIEYDPTKTSAEDLEALVKSLNKTIKK